MFFRRFSGYASANDWRTEANKLFTSLQVNGVYGVDSSAFIASGYDSPYKFFYRRNEVWLGRKDNSTSPWWIWWMASMNKLSYSKNKLLLCEYNIRICVSASIINLWFCRRKFNSKKPVYTVGRIVSVRVVSLVCFKQNSIRWAYCLTKVHAANVLKQTKDTFARLRFYAQCKPGLK